jgi:DNA-binding winged helix-turn-helix (wHTH) protein
MTRFLRFDGWCLDPDSGELSREGERIRLQEQPLRILQALLTSAGRVVTREQLVSRLWPRGIVDFETGLNTAMRRLRSVLHEDADAPRYIETLPRRGYRFIGSVEADEQGVHDLQTLLVGSGELMARRTECLVIVQSSQPGEVGRRYALTKGATSIGRGLENDIVLTGHSVSRQHTRIEMRGTEAFVVDTASTNGTFINDGTTPVRDGPLKPGDVLRIGDRSLAYLRGPDVEAQHRAVLARIAEVSPAAMLEAGDSRG